MGKYRTMLRHPTVRSKSFLYDLVREIGARRVVEVGVFGGLSTRYILEAMHDQGSGHLHSIDMPHPRLNGRPTGWLVPERLRDRWSLATGDSKQMLPTLVKNLGQVDLFHQEASDAYEDMMFEFETVWPYLRKGGFLVTEYGDRNQAIVDFAKALGLEPRFVKVEGGRAAILTKV